MNIGHMIESGIRRGESCCLCGQAIKAGMNCYPLTCGHIIHSSCRKDHIEAVKKAKKDGKTGNDVPQVEIVCPLDHERRISFGAVTIPPPPPPPAQPAIPHFGYQERELCASCHDGRDSFEKRMHQCGLLFCPKCFVNEKNTFGLCLCCGDELNYSSELIIDPRELEDNLES